MILAMDHIDKRLTTDMCNSRFNCAIRASLGVARKMLNRYYTLTDISEVYQIAMGTFVPLDEEAKMSEGWDAI